MNEIDKNYKWFEEHKKELLKDYKNQYVVIKKQQVIFSSNLFDEAVEFASKLELGTFIIQKVEKNETIQVFHSWAIFDEKK